MFMLLLCNSRARNVDYLTESDRYAIIYFLSAFIKIFIKPKNTKTALANITTLPNEPL